MRLFFDWSRQSLSPNCLLPTAALAGALFLAPHLALARSAGPFAGYAGNWRGSGQVVGTDGVAEPIRCRASYAVTPDQTNLTQALVCASDSYRFDIHSTIVADGEGVHGSWQEATRDVTGDLVGQIRDGLFEGTVTGRGFTAQLSVKMTRDRQIVSIEPSGADVASIDITLRR